MTLHKSYDPYIQGQTCKSHDLQKQVTGSSHAVTVLSTGGSEGWGWWLTGRSTATHGPECVCVSVSVWKGSQTAPFPDHLHNIAGHAESHW